MLRVGLTGNIASGKSSVARVWRDAGAHVVDADELARVAVSSGSSGLAAIRAEWGDSVLNEDGTLDRAAMRDIVFRDPVQRERLEAIIHPEVARLREERLTELQAAGVALAVSDIPLLFEVGLEGEFDLIVLVDAPAPVRHERLVRDRGLTAGAADRLIAAQLPAETKRERADIVIDNHGSLAQLEGSARAAWQELLRRAGET